ncbi:hypothetical protein M0R45_013618 [Rubus argutus]|uniref:Uncharacterized protein n=1 Tax=Rubus argutus TaxID=59490 RepID=A0AAW1XL17_RUBAR
MQARLQRWLSLLSEPYFLSAVPPPPNRLPTPVIGTTIFALPPNDAGKSQIFTLSKHPIFETTSSASNFSLRFIPCLRPLLVGCHDDLVVCCKTIATKGITTSATLTPSTVCSSPNPENPREGPGRISL